MTVVEDRPIMSVNHCLPVLLLTKTIMHPAARSLCDSWASCFRFSFCSVLYNNFSFSFFSFGTILVLIEVLITVLVWNDTCSQNTQNSPVLLQGTQSSNNCTAEQTVHLHTTRVTTKTRSLATRTKLIKQISFYECTTCWTAKHIEFACVCKYSHIKISNIDRQVSEH